MQCPRCQAENRKDHRFCSECGAPLAIVCPECGFSSVPGARFCGGCGEDLAPALRHAGEPEQAADAVVKAARGAPEAERRQITVMFCDLVGSTSLSERLDPEDLREVLRAYQATCAEVIDRYDGHIAKYIGDGLMVYFGYPQAHEDDAERAVHAGLEMVAQVVRLSDHLTEEKGIDLAVRLGLHTGLVIAGEMGAGKVREDLAIVGETPNIAARLEALAEPNNVVISDGTRRLVEGLFVCEALGPSVSRASRSRSRSSGSKARVKHTRASRRLPSAGCPR